jgi:hypothetical protein
MNIKYLRKKEVVELIVLTVIFVISCIAVGAMVVADLVR